MTAIPKPTPRPKVRKPLKSRPKGVAPMLREMVLAQYNFTCSWCEVPGGRLDMHHRQRRSQGGKDSLLNLVPLHRQCHRYVHEHPLEAYERGLLVRNGETIVALIP